MNFNQLHKLWIFNQTLNEYPYSILKDSLEENNYDSTKIVNIIKKYSGIEK
jgi:hypothetical protein